MCGEDPKILKVRAFRLLWPRDPSAASCVFFRRACFAMPYAHPTKNILQHARGPPDSGVCFVWSTENAGRPKSVIQQAEGPVCVKDLAAC